ncbi:MAG: hypothetical protein M2R45_00876 [Verrucomicrobia subdivision 3 bacterium]|nr:hypothetical protein [Limisphaerales bacterium]MCS1414544.1 hypothetical protein [Limisphaerales bacterium]
MKKLFGKAALAAVAMGFAVVNIIAGDTSGSGSCCGGYCMISVDGNKAEACCPAGTIPCCRSCIDDGGLLGKDVVILFATCVGPGATCDCATLRM